MRFKQFKPLLIESGNVFPGTSSFDQAILPEVLTTVNNALSKTGLKVIPIGSGANPVKGKMSGDYDVMTDEGALMAFFQTNDAKEARRKLADYFKSLGFDAAQTGVIVHVLVPMGKVNVQTDIMVAPNAEDVSRFHQHSLPQNSPYKGTDKIIVMSSLAKLKNMMWSPYQGLFARKPDGKKGDLISQNIDDVAKTLIGSNASGKDLGSVESIYAKLTPDVKEKLNAALANDAVWMQRRSEQK